MEIPEEIARDNGINPVGLVDRVYTEKNATRAYLKRVIPDRGIRRFFEAELARKVCGDLSDFAVEIPFSIVDDRGKWFPQYLPYFVAETLAKTRGAEERVEGSDINKAFSLLREVNLL